MEWIKEEANYKVPVKSWCREVEPLAMSQAANLARHPVVFRHVALMPDCHPGYGMPIGGVIACEEAVIPNAVGVDIGCGMGAMPTTLEVRETSMEKLRAVVEIVKEMVPCGEGHAHPNAQSWEGMDEEIDSFREAGWFSEHVRDLALRNLGTLGGGNHFIEVQASEDGWVWLMIHSGSRHLGNMIARYHNDRAMEFARLNRISLPDKDLAFLPSECDEGKAYIREMTFALAYAKENRRRIMNRFADALLRVFPQAGFGEAVNIHHNYAALETHFDKAVWVHRKGATSARKEELGIIPGSMGTPSYIVRGLGNPESFMSCSHGAGRVMGRLEASRSLTPRACNAAMQGIVHDRWNTIRRGKEKGMPDLGEAPQAYKDIDAVISSEVDLISPVVKLRPLAVVKG